MPNPSLARTFTAGTVTFVALLLLSSVALAGELQEKDVLDLGNTLATAINDLDYDGFHSPMAESDEEMTVDEWKEQTQSIQAFVGEIKEVSIDELKLPAGAYLNFAGTKSKLGIFLSLDEQGKVNEIQVFPGGRREGQKAECDTSDS